MGVFPGTLQLQQCCQEYSSSPASSSLLSPSPGTREVVCQTVLQASVPRQPRCLPSSAPVTPWCSSTMDTPCSVPRASPVTRRLLMLDQVTHVDLRRVEKDTRNNFVVYNQKCNVWLSFIEA